MSSEGKCVMAGPVKEQPEPVKPLGRDAILGVQDTDVKLCEVPGWGGGVYIRTISGRDGERVSAWQEAHPDAGDVEFMGWFLTLVICDKEGNPILEEGDAPVLAAKSFKALESLSRQAMDHNGLSESMLSAMEGN